MKEQWLSLVLIVQWSNCFLIHERRPTNLIIRSSSTKNEEIITSGLFLDKAPDVSRVRNFAIIVSGHFYTIK